MKKSFPVICLLLCFILSACSPSAPSASPAQSPSANISSKPSQSAEPIDTRTYGEPELDRALQLGIGAYSEQDEAVTFVQFMSMLDRAVELSDTAKLAEWKVRLPEARKSNKAMTRADAMFAVLCAAESLGEKFASANVADWGAMWEKIGNWEGKSAKEYGDSLNYDIFPATLRDGTPSVLFNPQDESETRYGDAVNFATCKRKSFYSGKIIFDYDEADQSVRAAAPLLYTEALLAALRLHDSGISSERALTADDEQILEDAEARKQSILSSPTTVKVTGTTYYVSNNGDDKKDGKSPEQAWATMDKVNSAKLKPGDGVFFERGGLWRNVLLKCQNGVTYSAYGKGEKPRFFGSPENGASPEKWSLLDGTANIWVFYKDMKECGNIVFNDGESTAVKTYVYWDIGSQRYVSDLSMSQEYSPSDLENLHFWSALNLKGYNNINNSKDYANENLGGLKMWECDRIGKLYLRCDDGNPGTVYNSIEFGVIVGNGDSIAIIEGDSRDVVIDNLSVRYNANCGISINSGSTLQNCEVSFVGGITFCYRTPNGWEAQGHGAANDIQALIDRAGDGVSLQETNRNALLGNYIHDCFDNAYTSETPPQSGITISQNLFERCATGVGNLTSWNPDNVGNKVLFKDILFKDNYCLYIGYGWGAIQHSNHEGSGHFYWFFGYNADQLKNIQYKNNVFYVSAGALFATQAASISNVVFSGNTYAQNNYGALFKFDEALTLYNNDAKQKIEEVLGDKNATVLGLSIAP